MPVGAILPLMLIRAAGLPLSTLESWAVSWQTAEEGLRVGEQRLTDAIPRLQKAFDQALQVLPASPARTALYNARKTFFQRQKLPAGLWAFPDAPGQTPELENLHRAVRDFRAAEAALQQARDHYRQQYERALEMAFRALQEVARHESFRRALLFSSHALLEQLPRFCAMPAENFTKKERQTALAVLQYAARMAVKTSPLSRFTTLGVQHSGQDAPKDYFPFPKAAVTPNVALLEALYDVLLRQPVFYRSLALRLNPCIVSLPEKTFNWLYFDGEQESFQEMETAPAQHLVAAYLLQHGRRAAFDTLWAYLQTAMDASPEALENFLLELADLGFLEWILPENGLSPGWCGGLYQYLGFLPAEPVVVQTAALLQWLRTAARTLPYQPVEAALATQKETREQLRLYFETFGGVMPPIAAEQLFYEDVEQHVAAPVPTDAVNELLEQLATAWEKRPDKPLPESREAIATFLKEICPDGQTAGFLDFARRFLLRASRPDVESGINRPSFQRHPHPLPQRGGGLATVSTLANRLGANRPNENKPPSPLGEGMGVGLKKATPAESQRHNNSPITEVRLGVLLQFYQENGRWHAVVNALYPGGGKMFARWLHLFPPNIKESLENWLFDAPAPHSKLKTQNSKLKTAFPWQGWFNANFQPALSEQVLEAPGGRVQARSGSAVCLLGDIEIENAAGVPLLRDRLSGLAMELNDLGLEAPESRPPVMRLLWQAGVPYVSLDALLPENRWQPLYEENIRYRARHTYRNLVLARAAWALAPAVWQAWEAADPVAFFMKCRAALKAMKVPRHFFARFQGEKPQYFDQDSPVLLLLLQKQLKQGAGTLFLTEMLPLPEQAVAGGPTAAEWVAEIRIDV